VNEGLSVGLAAGANNSRMPRRTNAARRSWRTRRASCPPWAAPKKML